MSKQTAELTNISMATLTLAISVIRSDMRVIKGANDVADIARMALMMVLPIMPSISPAIETINNWQKTVSEHQEQTQKAIEVFETTLQLMQEKKE